MTYSFAQRGDLVLLSLLVMRGIYSDVLTDSTLITSALVRFEMGTLSSRDYQLHSISRNTSGQRTSD